MRKKDTIRAILEAKNATISATFVNLQDDEQYDVVQQVLAQTASGSNLTHRERDLLVAKTVRLLQTPRADVWPAVRDALKEYGLYHIERADPRIIKAIVDTDRYFSVAEIFKHITRFGNVRQSPLVDQLGRDRRAVLTFLTALKHRAQHSTNSTNSKKACGTLTAIVYQTLAPASTKVIPKDRIQRNSRVNAVDGARFYDTIRLVVTKAKPPVSLSIRLLTDAIAGCHYTHFISPLLHAPKNTCVVLNATGSVVAAAAFRTYAGFEYHHNTGRIDDGGALDLNTHRRTHGMYSEQQRNGVRAMTYTFLKVDFLCSGKTCRGAGTAVMRALEQYARAQGFQCITLDAVESAVPFYLKLGYVPEGSVKSYALGTLHTPKPAQSPSWYGIVHTQFDGGMVKFLTPKRRSPNARAYSPTKKKKAKY
jgi:GNAT superfamily N-acetyltransferase